MHVGWRLGHERSRVHHDPLALATAHEDGEVSVARDDVGEQALGGEDDDAHGGDQGLRLVAREEVEEDSGEDEHRHGVVEGDEQPHVRVGRLVGGPVVVDLGGEKSEWEGSEPGQLHRGGQRL